MLLYELWVWKPFAVSTARSFDALCEHVKAGKLVDWSAAGMPTALREMAQECVNPDPSKRPSFADIMARFDDVLIDCLVWDTRGRALWRKFYRGRDTVLWVKLKSAIAEYVGVHPTERELKCLSAVLGTHPLPVIECLCVSACLCTAPLYCVCLFLALSMRPSV